MGDSRTEPQNKQDHPGAYDNAKKKDSAKKNPKTPHVHGSKNVSKARETPERALILQNWNDFDKIKYYWIITPCIK